MNHEKIDTLLDAADAAVAVGAADMPIDTAITEVKKARQALEDEKKAEEKVKAFDPVAFAKKVTKGVPDEDHPRESVAVIRSLVEVTTSFKAVVGGISAGAVAGTVAGVVVGRKYGLEGQALVDGACVGFAVGAKAGGLLGWGGAAVYNRLSR